MFTLALHPGLHLKDMIGENHTIKHWAHRIGISESDLTQFMHGQRNVTPELAEQLEKATGRTAQFWLDMQRAFDLTQRTSPGVFPSQRKERKT